LQPDVERYVESLSRLEGFAGVVLEESGGLSSIAVAGMLKRCCDKEIFLKVSCRDRNRIALHSELLTAAAFGLLNVVLADGAHPVHTRFPAAKPVYELDSLSLLRMIKGGSPSFDEEAAPALASLSWTVGVCVGGSTAADVARAKRFLAAGADVFFAGSLDAVLRLRNLTDKPVILSVPEEEATDVAEILREAESAGASGVNLIVKTPDKVLDGSIIAR
jgi:5,10-methylenetetrahydrofolate reductase